MSLPHDTDAEKAVLGALMLDGDAITSVSLKPEDFYAPRHGYVFRAVMWLHRNGQPVDTVTVSSALSKHGKLDEVGGKVALMEIIDATPRSDRADKYAEIVQRLSRLRTVATAAEKARVAVTSGADDPSKVIEALEADLSHAESTAYRERELGELLTERLDNAGSEREYVWMDGYPGIHLHWGEMFVIGGRPKTGKSSWITQQAIEWAQRHLPTRIYAFEMSDLRWAERVIAHKCAVTSHELDKGLSASEVEGVREQLVDLMDIRLTVVNASGMTPHELIADIRRFSRRGGRIVVIDYLQRIIRGSDRHEKVSDLSNALKDVAEQTQTLMCVVAQLNRQLVGQDGKPRKPVASDLRDSGAIEQDLDALALTHSYDSNDGKTLEMMKSTFDLDQMWRPDDRFHLSHVDFALMRSNPTRLFPAIYDGEMLSFTPLKRRER